MKSKFGIFVGKSPRLLKVEENITNGYFPNPKFDRDWEVWKEQEVNYPIGTLLYETNNFLDGLEELKELKGLNLPQLNLASPGKYRWAFLPRNGAVQLTYMGVTIMPQIAERDWTFSFSKGMCRARIPAEAVAYTYLSPVLLDAPDYAGNDQRPAPWERYGDGLIRGFVGNDGKILKAIGEGRSGTGWEAYEDEKFRGLSLNSHDGFEIYPILDVPKRSITDRLFGSGMTVA